VVTPVRILVAEDEAVVRRVLARALEEAGYLVVAVENGWEAWRQVQNEPFDLLVTDHVMPLLGGKKLVENVRGLHPSMPVILVSGNFIKGDTPGEYPSDIVMLAKPFQNEVLVRAVKDLLGGTSPTPR
jgi:two-component system cell cycle response regulator CpdR